MKFQNFSIAKIESLWRALNFKRGHGPPGPPFSATYGVWFSVRLGLGIGFGLESSSCFYWLGIKFAYNRIKIVTFLYGVCRVAQMLEQRSHVHAES